MSADRRVTLFHSTFTRSTGALALLEELGADYELKVMSLKGGDNRQPEFLAVNALGKVPTIRHGDAVVTEQVAIFIYLADLYPEAGLAPAIGDPRRGPYLRWLALYGSAFEPAIIDKAQKREPAPQAMSPYGDFDSLLAVLTDRLSSHDWLVGDTATAADILWGIALAWQLRFGLVPALPALQAYVERVGARPGVRRAREMDAEHDGIPKERAAG